MKTSSKAWFLILLFALTSRSEEVLEAISDIDPALPKDLPALSWNKDPFQRTPGFSKVTETPEKEPKLNAIIYSVENPSAIINGEVLSPGEYVYNRKLLEVGRNYVLLQADNSIIELTLPPKKEISTKLEIKELSNEK
jgi:hypothetical protein